MVVGTFGGDGILDNVQNENRVSIDDNNTGSIYGKGGVGFGGDGALSF